MVCACVCACMRVCAHVCVLVCYTSIQCWCHRAQMCKRRMDLGFHPYGLCWRTSTSTEDAGDELGLENWWLHYRKTAVATGSGLTSCCPYTLWTHQLLSLYTLWTHQWLSLHTLDSPAAVPTHSGLTSGCPYMLWTHQRLSLHALDSPAAVPTHSGLTSCCRYTLWTHQRLSLHTLDSPAAVPTHSGLTSCCRYMLWTHQPLSLHTLDSPATVATHTGLTNHKQTWCCWLYSLRNVLWLYQAAQLRNYGNCRRTGYQSGHWGRICSHGKQSSTNNSVTQMLKKIINRHTHKICCASFIAILTFT